MAIAFFDLDGTITHRDTLLPLVLRQLARHELQLFRLIGVLPAALRYLFDRDRRALKQSLLQVTLRGTQRDLLLATAREFVRETIDSGCFAEALATIRRHRDAGHYLVLMSASVDFYVPEFGKQLGFDQMFSTGTKWNGTQFDGTLTTPNLRGEEKARCVRELLAQRSDSHTFAYGNSASDLPHLKLVKHGFLVNGTRAARHEATALGVQNVDWS